MKVLFFPTRRLIRDLESRGYDVVDNNRDYPSYEISKNNVRMGVINKFDGKWYPMIITNSPSVDVIARRYGRSILNIP